MEELDKEIQELSKKLKELKASRWNKKKYIPNKKKYWLVETLTDDGVVSKEYRTIKDIKVDFPDISLTRLYNYCGGRTTKGKSKLTKKIFDNIKFSCVYK